MTALLAAIFAIYVAVAIVVLIVAAPRSVGEGASGVRGWAQQMAIGTENIMRTRGWGSTESLELAGMKLSLGAATLWVVIIVAAAGSFGAAVALTASTPVAWLLPFVLLGLAVLGVRMYFDTRVARRRARFADQLEDTLQLIAGGLRAGHSLARAIDGVAREADSPTAEEFTRVVNEHRLGRGLDDALLDVAERMKSDDLSWTAQAIGIHREVGGNLGEVLDNIAGTIRERQQVRRQVATLSSEGRVSAVVLVVLPIVVGLLLSIISPNYLAIFVESPLGIALALVSVVLFVIGGLWLRAITRIKY